MTNRIKTVQKPRLILVACKNSERMAHIISGILNFCSYNTCIDDFTQNTDFVIETNQYSGNDYEHVIPDTAVFDEESAAKSERLAEFRQKVTPYENAMKLFGEDPEDVITYSEDNYGADVACRNLSSSDGTTSFDIIGNGILGRVNIVSGKYSVDEVLACTGVLLAAGMPLASILGYFDYEEA